MISDLIKLLLTKKPEGYPHDHGEGDATLKGAIYEIRYYDRYRYSFYSIKSLTCGYCAPVCPVRAIIMW
jgi:ferredoxin